MARPTIPQVQFLGIVADDAKVIKKQKDGRETTIVTCDVWCNRNQYRQQENRKTQTFRIFLYGERAEKQAAELKKNLLVYVSGELDANMHDYEGKTYLDLYIDYARVVSTGAYFSASNGAGNATRNAAPAATQNNARQSGNSAPAASQASRQSTAPATTAQAGYQRQQQQQQSQAQQYNPNFGGAAATAYDDSEYDV